MEINYLDYEKMKVEIDNLKIDNKLKTKELKILRENAKNIITHFWMWYVSGNYKRDMSKKEEGEKYADDFLNDLVCEISGVVK